MFNGVSPSRTYVAICGNTDFLGYYFRKFKLPEKYKNTAETASWYFLNVLDGFSCVCGCVAFEDYSNLASAD